jgi:hypothetical protein
MPPPETEPSKFSSSKGIIAIWEFDACPDRKFLPLLFFPPGQKKVLERKLRL